MNDYELTAKPGKPSIPVQNTIGMLPGAAIVPNKDRVRDPVPVVYYDNVSSPGRLVGTVDGNPSLANKRTVKNADFAAMSRFNTQVLQPEPVTPIASPVPWNTIQTPVAQSSPLPVEPEVTVSAKPVIDEPLTTQNDSLSVTFERESGDSFTAYFHDHVYDGKFLTFVYDHNKKNGVLYRPGLSDEPIFVQVETKEPKVYRCYTTGYRLRYKNLEFIAFTVEDERSV